MDSHDKMPTVVVVSLIIAVTILRLAALIAVVWLVSKVIMVAWR